MSEPQTLSLKHSAPGPYLGFSLQPVRLCYYLLCSPAHSRISLEYLDDVAVHNSDGTVLLEQCKSALSHNALSDWSEDFWKSVANWLEAVQSKKIDGANASFKLYVTPPKKAGKISAAMHSALTPEDVQKIISIVKGKLSKKTRPPKCMPHVQRFLDADEDIRCLVIQRMYLVSEDTDPLEPLRALLAPTVPDASIDTICEAAIGMAKEWADKCIRRKSLALIDTSDFRKNFHAFVQRNNLAGYLPTFSTAPPAETTQSMLMDCPVFVRQLQLIEANEEQQVRAVSDFMRTSADKVKWANQGLVFEGSFSDWENSLLRRHAAMQGEIHDLHADRTEIIQGRTLYNRCSTLEIPLDSRTVPSHFTHGGFNELADRQQIGWHPQYRKFLANEEDE